MSLQQEQYYSAKVFLKHYSQAFQTLQLCAKHQGFNKEYLLARQGKSDRFIKSSDYASNLINRYIPNFRKGDDYNTLIKTIEQGISSIQRDIN